MKDFLKKLISAASTPEKGELQTALIIAEELKKAGIESEIDKWDENRANITARIGKKGGKSIILACHMDVVPPGNAAWKHPPFEPTEEDGKIYGRGSADMKGGIAAGIQAITELAGQKDNLNGEIIFTATAGEETNSCGVKRFLQNQGKDINNPVGIIIPEPTDFQAVTAHRGMLWVKVTTIGKTAHGSMPHLGVNAVLSMNKLLNKLKSFTPEFTRHPQLGDCSLSINTITGGKAINVIPDSCEAGIDIRTLPSQQHRQIISRIREIINSLKSEDENFNAEISIVREVEALETDTDSEFVRKFCDSLNIDETISVGFTTDAPFFAALDAPVVVFGAGDPHVCHKPDEYIEIKDLQKAADMYKKVILDCLR